MGSSGGGGGLGGGGGGVGDGSAPVKPSLYGLWAVEVGNPLNSRQPIAGVRIEFKVDSWVVDGREVECGVPLQLRQLISDDIEPEDPHKELGIGLIVVTALVRGITNILNRYWSHCRNDSRMWEKSYIKCVYHGTLHLYRRLSPDATYSIHPRVF